MAIEFYGSGFFQLVVDVDPAVDVVCCAVGTHNERSAGHSTFTRLRLARSDRS
jgi:hypothetical protein